MTVQARPAMVSQPDSDPGAIALCLSGGGLRATLFHLGLIRALRQATVNKQMALKAVREVYAVSGGSILAAHFLANYSSYIGEEEEFELVANKLLAFAGRDLRNRVLRRWPTQALVQNGRGRLLQREYHHFLGKRTIGQCYPQSGEIPTFHFLSTSFTTGALCSFSRTCFEQVDRDSGNSTAWTAADGLPLAFAVAASSAFPPMFPPMRLTPEALGTSGKPPFNSPIALSDGGIFDNFGIDKFCLAQRSGPAPGLLIVSNAGGSFETDPEHSYETMLSRNIRASDILMRRVGETTLGTGREAAGDGLIVVGIGATVPDGGIAETTQQRFRLVRTDLDRFDPQLARLLVGHGERIAHKALEDYRSADGAATFSLPPKTESPSLDGAASAERTAQLDRILSDAASSSWRGVIFSVRDLWYVALWWAAIGAVVGILLLLVYAGFSYVKDQQARVDAADRVIKDHNLNEARLERVRQATVKGDLQGIRNALALAIDTSKELGNSPTEAQPRTATAVTPAEVNAIIETPPVRPLQKTSYPQAVYIHFAGALTRAQITALNQALRDAGWKMMSGSGERLPAAAGKAEVRYAGENLAAAQALADALNRSGLPIRPVSPKYNSDIGGNLEVWISL